MEAVETIEYKGYEIKIYQNGDPESPREWDNLGTMVCFHRRYDLGDEHEYRSEDYSGWGEMEADIWKREDPAVVLPLYLYDHGVLVMATHCRFPDARWDAGQVGFIFISKKKVRYEYGAKRISRKLRERVEGYLVDEVETYSQWLAGDIYGYMIDDEDGDHLDSCWGFYGYDFEKSGLLADARRAIDYHVKSLPEPELFCV